MGFMLYSLASLCFKPKDSAMTSCNVLASNQPETQGEHEMSMVHLLSYRKVVYSSHTLLSVAGSRGGAVSPLSFFLRSTLTELQNGSMDSA